MDLFGEILVQLKSFFRLDFLLGGLGLTAEEMFWTRAVVFVLFVYISFRVLLRLIDLVKAVFLGLLSAPGLGLVILVLLAIPMSPDSLGRDVLPVIVFSLILVLLGVVAATVAVLVKYGPERAIEIMRRLKTADRSGQTPAAQPPSPEDAE